MKLPKRDLPQYTTKLDASGVTVKYRPHTVKEEQIINMAMMSDEDKDKVSAILQIVENCVDYDITKLYRAEIEYLYMKIRATSDTSVVPVVYHIDRTEVDEKTGELVHKEDCPDVINSAFDINRDVNIEFDKSEMEKYAVKSKAGGWIIKLADDLRMVINIKPLVEESEDALYELLECVVVTDEESGEDNILYKDTDFNNEEFREWIEDLPSSAFDDFSNFMIVQPACKAKLKFKCKCGKVYEEEEEGILRFLI